MNIYLIFTHFFNCKKKSNMKFDILIFLIISVFNISVIFSVKRKYPGVCEHFVINKNSKCKLKTFSNNNIIKNICVCRDMNVKPVWTNSTLQTLESFHNPRLPFNIYFKLKKPLILNKKQPIFDQSFF